MSDSTSQAALQAIIQSAALLPLDTARRQEFFDLGGPDPETGDARAPYPVTQRRIGVAIRELRKAAREIKALRAHTHDFGRDDFCQVCGADGRA